MRTPLYNPWAVGGGKKMFEPALAACLVLFLLFAPAVWAADAAPPLQKLAISFDLDQSLMRATSRIEIPSGPGVDIYLGDLQVDKLTIDGKDALGSILQGDLQLPAAKHAQQVTIDYHLQESESGGDLISSKGISLTGLWHPQLGRPTHFELTAMVPARFEAISEANEIVTTEIPGGKRVRFEFPQPVKAINFVAGPYMVDKVPFEDGKELYTYFFPEDQKLAAEYRTRTLGYLARYEREIGPFPYKRFSVVENRLPTGFSMPTFTLLGQMVVRLPFITKTSLGHEVLHQWFGNAVEVDTSKGNWAEGLVTDLADQAFAAEKGKGARFRKDQLIKYESYIHKGHRIPLAKFVGVSGRREVRDDGLRAIGYAKGSMVFHMLRQRLGKKKFLTALRDFYARMRYRSAAWPDLIKSFEKVSGKNLGVFFKQWLNRANIPGLAISNLRLETEKTGQELAFDLVQTEAKPYSLEVPVAVETIGGTIRQRIATDARITKVRIPVANLPESLTLDPDYDLMRHLALPELPPVWSRFEGAPRKLAIMAPKEKPLYEPLFKALASYGAKVKVISPQKVTDKDLAEFALLFLGTDTGPVHSLFAKPELPATGFTIDVRPHPLVPRSVAVLVTSASPEETARAAGLLRHYGKYSYLHFENGQTVEKKIAPSQNGQHFPVFAPPRGVATPQTMGFENIIDRLSRNRVVYVGETHTSYADHLLELQVIQALHQREPKLAIGMEMFSRPVQKVLDEYIDGTIGEWEFLKKSHWYERWRFDYRLYRGILDYARNNRIPVIALNMDQKIVDKVFMQGGVYGLSAKAKKKLPPDRDLAMPGYQERLLSVFLMHRRASRDLPASEFAGFFQAQAIWDETMAATTADYLRTHPETRMVVLAGREHVLKGSGIPPRVERRLPVKQAVVCNDSGRGINPANSDYVFFEPPVRLSPPVMLGVMLKTTKKGLEIEGFTPHGPAKAAGLKKGDYILAINDDPVRKIEDLKIALLYQKPGYTVRLRVLRPREFLPDQLETFKVTL